MRESPRSPLHCPIETLFSDRPPQDIGTGVIVNIEDSAWQETEEEESDDTVTANSRNCKTITLDPLHHKLGERNTLLLVFSP